jgi:23S rRNA (cytosine1962-C5)-methyltransferase
LGLIDNPTTNAYRFINSEGDGMPGLVADYYDSMILFQAQSSGMQMLIPTLAESLRSIFQNHLGIIYSKAAEYTNHFFQEQPPQRRIFMGECRKCSD